MTEGRAKRGQLDHQSACITTEAVNVPDAGVCTLGKRFFFVLRSMASIVIGSMKVA